MGRHPDDGQHRPEGVYALRPFPSGRTVGSTVLRRPLRPTSSRPASSASPACRCCVCSSAPTGHHGFVLTARTSPSRGCLGSIMHRYQLLYGSRPLRALARNALPERHPGYAYDKRMTGVPRSDGCLVLLSTAHLPALHHPLVFSFDQISAIPFSDPIPPQALPRAKGRSRCRGRL